MSIYRNSRYEYSSVAYHNPGPVESSTPVLYYYFDELGTVSYIDYVWKEGDRPDVVAYSMFHNSQAWWTILEHNPEIVDPMNIPAGTVLRIPYA